MPVPRFDCLTVSGALSVLGLGVMGDRRLVLVVGSQCAALGRPLSFLPDAPGPVEPAGLPARQRLVLGLLDLLVDGPGGCAPVSVKCESAPGLLLNPTKAVADAALLAALQQADELQAVLVVHFVGHGSRHQDDPAAPARHLLHVWDTVAKPVDTEPESNGWDPYELIRRRRNHLPNIVGLVLLVDACYASWAKQQVDAWSGVQGGLLSAWLGSSGDQPAWDGCFTKTLVQVLGQGLDVAEHPRRALVPDLLASDLEPVLTGCQDQAPRLGGFESHNPVLFVARNRRASQLGAALGVDAGTETLLLRLTESYVTFAVDMVTDSIRAHRVTAVVGGPGAGKSTLAAALRHPPASVEKVPLGLVHAVGFMAVASSVPELAATLRGQLQKLAWFPEVARRYWQANAARWDDLDPWQRLTGPLSLYPDPVRLLVDGLDQLEGQPGYPEVLHALQALVDDPALGHVKLVLVGRSVPALGGVDAVVDMPVLDVNTATRYLHARGVLDPGTVEWLVQVAAGNWLVLDLAATTVSSVAGGAGFPEDQAALYTQLLDQIRTRHGGVVDVVMALLAAAGTGPVLPFDLLHATLVVLGQPLTRADLYLLLGDVDLHRLLDRSNTGRADEHLGLFHQTLGDYLTTHPRPGTPAAPAVHAAIIHALDQQAPATKHTPGSYRDDPLLTYAFDVGPRHRHEAGRDDSLVADLTRDDPVPRVNLTRWTTWASVILDALGCDHPDTLTTRSIIAYWTAQTGDPSEALRLLRQLLPDQERVLGRDHPDTLTTR
ncbi:tetratricopeptide repeat protein, partial [Actinopolymorpha cephalotaxi]